MEVITVKNMSKQFDGNIALDGIDFKIHEGEIFGFLGPSGAGKTTTINILTGQLSSDSGNATLLNHNVSNLTSNDLENIGIVSDNSGYYEKLTLYKNLLIYAKLHNVSKDTVENLLYQVDLLDSKDKIVENLSTGMKQRMLLARSLINNPKVLFLDEPTSGLDPYTSKKIHQLLLMIKNNGTTIFLTTHDMNEATLLCDNLVLLNKGKIVESGNPRKIIAKHNTNPTVIINYLSGEKKTIDLNLRSLNQYFNNEVYSIHTCEPTLEDIFIKLTGEELNNV